MKHGGETSIDADLSFIVIRRDHFAFYTLEEHNVKRSFQAMLPLIIVIAVAVAIAIGGYQLLIQKYYWGPNGPPKKNERNSDSSQK